MTEEREYCSKVIKTEFNKPLLLTKKHHERFNLLLDVGFGFVKNHMKKVM